MHLIFTLSINNVPSYSYASLFLTVIIILTCLLEANATRSVQYTAMYS